MTDITAVEISIDECHRYLARAEKAHTSLQEGEDNNSYTTAMKRASMDLTNALVAVRGNNKEAKEKPSGWAIKAPDIPSMEEVQKDIQDNTFTCSKCGKEFVMDDDTEPDTIDEKVYCEACFEHELVELGIDDAEAQYHCPECGVSWPIGFKETRGDRTMCSSCWITEDNRKIAVQPSNEWKPTPGTANGQYRCLEDEMVELRYGSCTPIKLSWVEIWTMVDSNGLAKEINSLLGDIRTNNKITAVRSFVKAVRAGKIPEAQDGDA